MVASTKKRKGYVYVTRRLSQPDIYKIGFTADKPSVRIYNSYRMYGKDEGWYPVYVVYCSVPFNTEQRVHKELSKYRVSSKNELFDIDINTIKNSILRNAPTIFYEIVRIIA
ncbi:MAG TPA: GIY-YIG nuclease family protein, partial [Crenotrichaceae bacterium]|nr:GIY-YIG nuclease family protein [Crenotrichaceae bacterium]